VTKSVSSRWEMADAMHNYIEQKAAQDKRKTIEQVNLLEFRLIPTARIYIAACIVDKRHVNSTWAWISLACFSLHAAAPWMPRSLLHG
jgi:hypothetical protein